MSLFEQLGDFLINAVYMLIYPFIHFISIIISAIADVVNSILGIVTSLMSLGNAVNSLVLSTVGLFLEDTWTGLIMLQISMVVLFRVYRLIRSG